MSDETPVFFEATCIVKYRQHSVDVGWTDAGKFCSANIFDGIFSTPPAELHGLFEHQDIPNPLRPGDKVKITRFTGPGSQETELEFYYITEYLHGYQSGDVLQSVVLDMQDLDRLKEGLPSTVKIRIDEPSGVRDRFADCDAEITGQLLGAPRANGGWLSVAIPAEAIVSNVQPLRFQIRALTL